LLTPAAEFGIANFEANRHRLKDQNKNIEIITETEMPRCGDILKE